MIKAIVTGDMGFIGKNFVSRYGSTFEFNSINEDIFNDVNWYDVLLSAMEKYSPSVVFHIGACSNTMESDVNYMMIRNYQFTKVLSDYCYKNDIPFIYSSSAANYGVNGIHPSNLYGWSKYVAEDCVLKNNGVALRFFNVYGPGEEHKGDMASVAFQMYIKNLKGFPIQLFPKKPTRDFVFVSDVVDAIYHSYLNYYDVRGEYYDVGVGVSKSFEDILHFMGITYSYLTEKDIPSGYQFYTCSDSGKWMPGWKPNYSLEMGITTYIEYLRSIYEF